MYYEKHLFKVWMKVPYEENEKGILDKLSYVWILYNIK